MSDSTGNAVRPRAVPISAAVLLGLFVTATGAIAAGAKGGPAAAIEPASSSTTVFSRASESGRAKSVRLAGGLSGDWRRNLHSGAQIGGTAIGGERRESGEVGSSSMGDKFKAGLLSALLPGAGQFYNGDRTKAYVMGGVEVAIWGAYFVFDKQGDNRTESYREYAGIYAGVSGGHSDSYWQAVGDYMDSDAYNEALLREARALDEPPPPLIGADDAWQWRNQDFMINYRRQQGDAVSAYDRRDFVILFAVVNRAISVYDAVRNAGPREPNAAVLGAEVLGWEVAVEVKNSWRDPGTCCVVSRSF